MGTSCALGCAAGLARSTQPSHRLPALVGMAPSPPGMLTVTRWARRPAGRWAGGWLHVRQHVSQHSQTQQVAAQRPWGVRRAPTGQPAALGWWAVGRGLVAGSTQAAGEEEERLEGAGSPCLQVPRCGGFVCSAPCCRCAGSPQPPRCAVARPCGCGFSLARSRRAGSSHPPRGALWCPHGGSGFGLWFPSWDAFRLDFPCALGLSTHLSTCRQDPACTPTVPSTTRSGEPLSGSGE